MNPLTNMKNVLKLSEQELNTSNKTSWHDQYRDSAWLFIGGLPYGLTEGDIICIFSQYGEIVTINLVRDKDTGKSKGFCFVCYEDQRSTDLTVDNLNGIKVLGRTIRVDHVSNYKVPKESRDKAAEIKKNDTPQEPPKKQIKSEPLDSETPNELPHRVPIKTENDDIKLPMRLPIYPIKEENSKTKKIKKEKKKKDKKEKKKKSKKKKHKRESTSDDDTSTDSSSEEGYKHRKRRKSSEKR